MDSNNCVFWEHNFTQIFQTKSENLAWLDNNLLSLASKIVHLLPENDPISKKSRQKFNLQIQPTAPNLENLPAPPGYYE